MRSDTKALFKLFAWSALLAVVVVGILAAAAFGVIDREVGIGLAIAVLIAGPLLFGRRLSRGLLGLPHKADRPRGDQPPPARPWDKKS
jgi:hypothetical protein